MPDEEQAQEIREDRGAPGREAELVQVPGLDEEPAEAGVPLRSRTFWKLLSPVQRRALEHVEAHGMASIRALAKAVGLTERTVHYWAKPRTDGGLARAEAWKQGLDAALALRGELREIVRRYWIARDAEQVKELQRLYDSLPDDYIDKVIDTPKVPVRGPDGKVTYQHGAIVDPATGGVLVAKMPDGSEVPVTSLAVRKSNASEKAALLKQAREMVQGKDPVRVRAGVHLDAVQGKGGVILELDGAPEFI